LAQKKPGARPGLSSEVLISLPPVVVVVNPVVVMTHPGVGRDSGACEDGESDNCKQHVTSDSHNSLHPLSGAAFALRPGQWMQN